MGLPQNKGDDRIIPQQKDGADPAERDGEGFYTAPPDQVGEAEFWKLKYIAEAERNIQLVSENNAMWAALKDCQRRLRLARGWWKEMNDA